MHLSLTREALKKLHDMNDMFVLNVTRDGWMHPVQKNPAKVHACLPRPKLVVDGVYVLVDDIDSLILNVPKLLGGRMRGICRHLGVL